jgi:pyridoxine/pyridoxamine 5'-phosphate oxidase
MTVQNVLQNLKEKQFKLCVISTCSHTGTPESAVLGYAVKDDLSVIVSTHTGSRKWKNIEKQSAVSLVFGWTFDELNLQYEGVATLYFQTEDAVKTEEFFFTQNPHAKQFKSDDTGYIVIKPTWIRVTDPRVHPAAVTELTDF